MNGLDECMAEGRPAEEAADIAVASPVALVQRDPMPKVLYVELADYCNLDCIFCGRGAYVAATGDKGGFIDFEALQKLEQPLRAAEVLGLSGRIGEPLLHPKLHSILEWIYKINPKIRLRITTNGTALSRKMAALVGGHLDFLAISLNASNATAYFREMRPVGHNASPEAWWRNLTRRIGDFIGALPASDRGRVRIIAPVQRDNIDDVSGFVRLVASMGCSHAIFSPMFVHDDSKIDMSVYWIKDKYNDVMDEAAALGATLGVRVEAARFYTNPKLKNVDLESLCREPLEAAYLNMEKLGGAAPCCQWIEGLMPADVYGDEGGFERFWNSDVYKRLRAKRDFKSCKACGMARPFDEVGFHFTPLLKKNLVASRRCAEAEIASSYPDSDLVGLCRDSSLDVPSLRRTLLASGVPTERLDSIRLEGLGAVAGIDKDCWEAFLARDAPVADDLDLPLGGCFSGVGWFHADNDPVSKISARWMGGCRAASVYLRLRPGYTYKIQATAHHLNPPEMVRGLGLAVGDRSLEVHRDLQENGTCLVTADLPVKFASAYDGRLWLRVIYDDSHGIPGWVSFSRIRATRLSF